MRGSGLQPRRASLPQRIALPEGARCSRSRRHLLRRRASRPLRQQRELSRGGWKGLVERRGGQRRPALGYGNRQGIRPLLGRRACLGELVVHHAGGRYQNGRSLTIRDVRQRQYAHPRSWVYEEAWTANSSRISGSARRQRLAFTNGLKARALSTTGASGNGIPETRESSAPVHGQPEGCDLCRVRDRPEPYSPGNGHPFVEGVDL